MYNKSFKYPDTKAFNYVCGELEKLGVTFESVAEIAYEMQKKHEPDITIKELMDEAENVMHKRDFLNAAMVALTLDKAANEKTLPSPLQEIVENDTGVFGVDETLAISVSQLFGTIGVSNYGFIDIAKIGVIKELDEDKSRVTTFVDDIVGAWASAVSAKIAHKRA